LSSVIRFDFIFLSFVSFISSSSHTKLHYDALDLRSLESNDSLFVYVSRYSKSVASLGVSAPYIATSSLLGSNPIRRCDDEAYAPRNAVVNPMKPHALTHGILIDFRAVIVDVDMILMR
jgi:hypothetical protein